MPKNISDDVKGAKSIKAILGNLKAIAKALQNWEICMVADMASPVHIKGLNLVMLV